MTFDRTIPGLTHTTKNLMQRTHITIRVTADEFGKSLSLTNGKIMLQIPVEPVMDLLWILVAKQEDKNED